MEEVLLGSVIIKYIKKGFSKFVKFIKFVNGDFDEIINAETESGNDNKKSNLKAGENIYTAKELHNDHQIIFKINGNAVFTINNHHGEEKTLIIDNFNNGIGDLIDLDSLGLSNE